MDSEASPLFSDARILSLTTEKTTVRLNNYVSPGEKQENRRSPGREFGSERKRPLSKIFLSSKT